MSTAAVNKPAKAKGAFSGLAGMLADGFDPILSTDDRMERVNVDDIEVLAQVREEFEDEENTLEELGDSLKVRQLQNIVVRPNTDPGGKRYLLVIGERRLRSAKASGQHELWALIATMSAEEAEDAQLAENVQRKNLTQLEEAKRLQRDLAALGSVEAVLAKHRKSHAWLSKRLTLLDLPEQAQRLLRENISADIELIQQVKQIETRDAPKAKELVDDLKKNRGKAKARDLVAAVKDQVKPPKASKKAKAAGGSVATQRDRSIEEPSAGSTSEGAHSGGHVEPLTRAFALIAEQGVPPHDVLEAMQGAAADAVESYLGTFYEAGKQAVDVAGVVIEGFRNGGFAAEGVGAFALVAYLHGVDRKTKFNLLNILGAVKPSRSR